MRDLHYETRTTDRHTIYVATWQETGHWWTRLTIDGVTRAYENLGPVVEATTDEA